MSLKNTALLAAGLLTVQHATAQTVNNVTEIITDFGGFWQSSSATNNPVKPNNSHDLLAFTLNNTRYSTGVDDALLRTNNITFVAGQYKSLPVQTVSGTIGANTKIGLGAAYDGVASGASSPAPVNNIPYYLRDGRNGLNLGTGVANVPSGNLDFTISDVVASTAGDGIPDIVVTQVADPSGSQDQYQFLDAAGAVVGTTVTVTFTSITPVGNWTADFYEASQKPMTLGAGFTNTERQLRLWSADLSAFGITAANAGSIRSFRVRLSGNSDLAFVAYNTLAATFSNPPVPLPVQLTSFSGTAASTHTTLTWNTAQELNSAVFEVQASTDGRTFATVGQVAAAGTTTQAQRYTYRHATTQAGPRYYRLRQLDQDGSSTTTSVLVLTAERAAGQGVQVTAAPNPFSSTLQLRFSGADAALLPTTVQLTTLAGRLVCQHDAMASAEKPLTLELAQLPAGMYLARVTVSGHTTVLKVVKQ